MAQANAWREVVKTDGTFGQEGPTLGSLESPVFPFDSIATKLDQAPSLGRLSRPPAHCLELV